MRTPQLTEQYGQVDRTSLARAILSSLSCATAGVRSNPRIETPAPPTSAPLIKVLRENSIAHPPTASNHKPNGLHPKLQRTINLCPLTVNGTFTTEAKDTEKNREKEK